MTAFGNHAHRTLPARTSHSHERLKAGGRVSTCSNMAKLGVTEDVLSARLIVSSLLSDRALRQLLDSQLFIEVGVVCGIGWNGAQV